MTEARADDAGASHTVNSIDLNNPPSGHDLSVSVERQETPGERSVRLFKDVALFVLGLVLVGAVLWLCLTTLQSATAGSDEKRWAQSVLSAAVGGVIGYLVRK